MPPRPRPIPVPRRASNAKSTQDSKALMPPPPAPAPPMGILELEVNALSGCLQNVAVKTAQVVRFHHDARQLNIRRHAADPPQSLQASLGRELEKYDQLCDAIEAQLIRAISILQRDLKKEQQRIRDEEKAAAEAAVAAAAKAEAEAAASAQTASMSPKMTPSESIAASIASASQSSAPIHVSGARRPSAISISSLNRPAFPLKLDLSAQSLRMSAEDPSFMGSGLRSPVTLAPKSARPIDYDIMAAFHDPRVDIDLTLPQEGSSSGMNLDLNTTMGSSADKPIELDMDINMSDLFGDSEAGNNNDTNADLFSPVLDAANPGGPADKVDNSFLSSIGVGGIADDANADIFASFGVGAGGHSTSRPDVMGTQAAPSPASLLASLSQSSVHVPQTENLPNDEPFDLTNLSDLDFLNNTDMNLDSLWLDTPGGGALDGDHTKPSL